MRMPSIAIRVNSRQPGKLVLLANRVYECMYLNSYFIDPNPSLNDVRLLAEDVTTAMAAAGSKGNRGSHADYLDLKTKSLRLHLKLKSLSKWVMTSSTMQSGLDYSLLSNILGTSGFEVTGERRRHTVLEPVENFRNFLSRALRQNQCKLKWSKPLNTVEPRDVLLNDVYMSTTPDFTTATLIGQTTKKEFLFTNNSSEMITAFFWIVPYNNRGRGVVSKMLKVDVLAA
jgi:hypothetical protein